MLLVTNDQNGLNAFFAQLLLHALNVGLERGEVGIYIY